MNDEINKNKIKIEEIMKEIDDIKGYINSLANNSKGDKLEGFIDKLDKDVIKTQNKLETIYIDIK